MNGNLAVTCEADFESIPEAILANIREIDKHLEAPYCEAIYPKLAYPKKFGVAVSAYLESRSEKEPLAPLSFLTFLTRNGFPGTARYIIQQIVNVKPGLLASYLK
ncbi:MAG: hypothetical protein JXB23_14795 [Candidatus Aminicenantes bacterium]|nr:hypothetical protein [Candidatus Aminicenantes bacterium]